MVGEFEEGRYRIIVEYGEAFVFLSGLPHSEII